MIHGAILKRDVVRTLRARWAYAIVLGLLAFAKYLEMKPHEVVSLLAMAFTCGATVSAYQSLAGEHDEEMLDMLATAPIPLRSVLIEIPLACTLAWGLITLVPVACVQLASREWVSDNWLVALPFALLFSAHAALFTLGFGQSFFAHYLGVAAEAGVLYALYHACRLASHGPVGEVVPTVFALAVASWVARLWLKRAQGVHWPEAAHDKSAQSARVGWSLDRLTLVRVLATSWWRPAPDGFPALLWRELFRGLTLAALGSVALLVALHRVFQWPAALWPLAVMPGCFLLAYVTGWRTARDRHGPIWDELRVVPMSAAAICAARVIAPLVHGLIVLLPSAVLAWASMPLMQGWELAVVTSIVAGLWVLAVLSGYVAGLRVRGWAASLAGAGVFGGLMAASLGATVLVDKVVRALALRPAYAWRSYYELGLVYGIGALMLLLMIVAAYMETKRED